MSRQITIQEGGQPKSLTVDKLQTALVGGGSCLWVPEEDTQLKTKHITANGTYQAASDDAYGYSEVTVNVAGGNGSADSHGVPTISGGVNPGGIGSSVIGKDPETGNDVAVGVDEDGNLVQTPVPSYIKVTKPPDKTEYHAGETINPTGIIVHAYLADGTDFGTVLNSELVYPEPVVPEGGGSGEKEYEKDGVRAVELLMDVYSSSGWPKGMRYRTPVKTDDSDVDHPYLFIKFGNATEPEVVLLTRYQGRVYGTGTKSALNPGMYSSSDPSGASGWGGYPSGIDYNGNYIFGASVAEEDYSNILDLIPESTVSPDGVDMRDADVVSVNVKIPVRWKSPYDGREMEDSFEITVTGGTGGGGTTVDDGGFSGGGGTF